MWFSLNSLLTVVFAIDGSLYTALPKVAAIAPVLVAGVVVGEYLHHRVDEQRFRNVVYALLLFTGSLLIITGF